MPHENDWKARALAAESALEEWKGKYELLVQDWTGADADRKSLSLENSELKGQLASARELLTTAAEREPDTQFGDNVRAWITSAPALTMGQIAEKHGFDVLELAPCSGCAAARELLRRLLRGEHGLGADVEAWLKEHP